MRGGRLRLVYLVSTLRRAGPTSQLLNLLRHLDPARFDPVVVGGLARAKEFDAGTPVYVKGLTAAQLKAALKLP